MNVDKITDKFVNIVYQTFESIENVKKKVDYLY